MIPIPDRFADVALLIIAAVLVHAILWTRNRRFLWGQRWVILKVMVIAEVWMAITDPIGGWWGAWFFDPTKVVGVWFLGVMPVEDFLGAAVVSSAAACAVLVFGYSRRRWI